MQKKQKKTADKRAKEEKAREKLLDQVKTHGFDWDSYDTIEEDEYLVDDVDFTDTTTADVNEEDTEKETSKFSVYTSNQLRAPICSSSTSSTARDTFKHRSCHVEVLTTAMSRVALSMVTINDESFENVEFFQLNQITNFWLILTPNVNIAESKKEIARKKFKEIILPTYFIC